MSEVTAKSVARHYALVLLSVMYHNGLSGARVIGAARGARHLSLQVKLKSPKELDKALALSEQIALSSNVASVLALRDAGVLVYQFALREHLWKSYSRANTPADAIGFTESDVPVLFNFMESRPHVAFAGTTGSGKTESMKSALYSIASKFTPEQCKVIVLDCFNNFSDFQNLAHLYTPIANDDDSIKQAIILAEQELSSRIDSNSKDRFRLVLFADEAESIFASNSLTNRLKSIAKTGRQFRVNLVLGSQDFREADLPGIAKELNNRFVGLVRDASISARLTGVKGLEAHKLLGAGDFLHVQGSKTVRFQVSRVLEGEYKELPRAEIKEPEIISFSAPTEIVSNYTAGRPALEIEPELAAMYFYMYPTLYSYNAALDAGISRRKHELHRGFTIDFVKAYSQLLQDGVTT